MIELWSAIVAITSFVVVVLLAVWALSWIEGMEDDRPERRN